MAWEPPDRWPELLAEAIGAETPDFVVRTARLTSRRDIRRILIGAAIASIPGWLVVGAFGIPGVAYEPPPLHQLLIVWLLFESAAIGFVIAALLHRFRPGAWIAGTPGALIVLYKERLLRISWHELNPVVALYPGKGGATAVIGEGASGSVLARLRRPGFQVPDHADAVRVAAAAWRRIVPTHVEPGQSLERPPPGAPRALHAALEDDEVVFVRKAARSALPPRLGRLLLGPGFVLLGLVPLTVSVLGFLGIGTVRSGSGTAATVVPPGSYELLALFCGGLFFVYIGALCLYADLILPLGRGPWFAGTRRGLVEVGTQHTRWYAWRAFDAVERPFLARRSLLLTFQMGVHGDLSESTGRRAAHLALVGIEDRDVIAADLERRMGSLRIT